MLDCVEGRRRTRRQRETAETPPAVARTHILCLDGTPQTLALARKRRLCLKGRRRTKGTSRNKINYASSADVGDGTSLKRQTPNTAAAACWYREPERSAHTAKTHRLCAEGRPRTKAIAGAHRLCVKGRQRSAAKHRLCAGERLRTTALAGNHGLCFEGQRRTPALAGRHRHNTANNHATPLTIKYMTYVCGRRSRNIARNHANPLPGKNKKPRSARNVRGAQQKQLCDTTARKT